MERLDTITRRVLADLRDRMDERKARAGDEPAREVAARRVGFNAARVGDEVHPRSPQRSIAKKTTGIAAKISAPK